MGMYIQLNLQCRVKPEYRNQVNCFLEGKWADSSISSFADFGHKFDHAEWISSHSTADIFYPSLDNEFDSQSGHWSLSCAFKNNDHTVQEFYNLLPQFVEEVEELEEISEQPFGLVRVQYRLVDEKIVEFERSSCNLYGLI